MFHLKIVFSSNTFRNETDLMRQDNIYLSIYLIEFLSINLSMKTPWHTHAKHFYNTKLFKMVPTIGDLVKSILDEPLAATDNSRYVVWLVGV